MGGCEDVAWDWGRKKGKVGDIKKGKKKNEYHLIEMKIGNGTREGAC